MTPYDPDSIWFTRMVAEEAEKRRRELYRPLKLLLPVVVFLILLASVASSGCGPMPFDRTEYGPELREEATIVEAIYQPRNSGHGSGLGMSSRGSLVVTSSSISIPAKWAVVFKCQHGKFIVEGTRDEHRKLWEQVSVGDEVTVRYREEFLAKFDESGKQTSRDVVDYDFLGIEKKKEEETISKISSIGQNYDLFYAACDCREEV